MTTERCGVGIQEVLKLMKYTELARLDAEADKIDKDIKELLELDDEEDEFDEIDEEE